MGVTRRWSWLGVLVIGVVLFEAVRQTLVATGNPALVPTLILIGAAVIPLAFVDFMAARRLEFSIGAGTIALTALFGGVVGVVAAGALEFDTLQSLGVLPMLAVGFIEEAAKLIVPVVLVLALRRHRRAADGLVVGVACGAGFAVLETMGYAFVTLIQSRGSVGAVDGVLLLRGLLSPAGHMAWTGLTAAALWHAAIRGWRPRPVLLLVLAYLVAVGLHTAWDSLGGVVGYVVVAAVSLVLLGWTTHRIGGRHRHSRPAATPVAV
jgi:protease PrsW